MTDTWPPRWQGPNFKGTRVTTKQLRARKSGKLKRAENKNKERVRERDGKCRFPLCGCHRLGLFAEVSHQEHKGMGGDPTGERSQPALMIYICNWRHKESRRLAIDCGTLRWVALTDAGANGPVAWEIDIATMRKSMLGRVVGREEGWLEIARETAVGEWEPFSDSQRMLLENLALMRL